MPTYYSGAGTTSDPRKYYSDQAGTVELSPEESKNVDITTAIPLQQKQTPTYNRIPATPSVDVAISEKKAIPATPTEEDVYAQELAKRRDEIAAIDKKYDTAIMGEEEAGKTREGGLRATLAGFGLGGSFTALGERNKNVTTTERAKQYQNALRAQEIGSLYKSIDTESQKLYEAQLKQNTDEADKAKANLITAGEGAIKSLATGLAEKGIASYEDATKLDTNGELKKIKDALGYSDYQMHQMWDSALPEEYKSTKNVLYSDAGNGQTKRTVITFNPITRKTSKYEDVIDAPVSAFQTQEKPIEVNGMLLVKQADGSYKNVAPTAQGGTFKQIGVDNLGNPTYGFVNEQTGVITPANQGQGAPTGQVPSNINIFGIKSTATTIAMGGQDSGVKSSDGGTFLSSQGEAKDTEIAKQLLTSDIYKNLSVDEALKKWSNNGYGADAVPGIDKNAKIGSLSDAQINQVLDGIKTREGIAQKQTSVNNPEYDKVFAEDPKLNREAFDKLPNDIVKTDVLSLINGDALISDIAKGMGGAKKAEAYNAWAKQIDPSYSENVNKQRYAFKNKWNTDRSYYQTRVSINTALSHMARLNEISKLLENSDIAKYNTVANFVAENINKPGIADAVAQFQDTVNLLGTEIARAYKGGVPDQNEIAQQQQSLNSSRPANIVQSVLNNKSYLMASAMRSMAEEYKKVMGKYPDETMVNTKILDEFESAGLDVKNLIKSFPIGSTFEYKGNMVTKKGDDDYELAQ